MKAALALILTLVSPLAFAAQQSLNIRGIIWDVVVLGGVAVIFGLLWYAIDKAPFIMEPLKGFIKWMLIVVAVLICIYMILGWIGL
jgi:hypothetical protein